MLRQLTYKASQIHKATRFVSLCRYTSTVSAPMMSFTCAPMRSFSSGEPPRETPPTVTPTASVEEPASATGEQAGEPKDMSQFDWAITEVTSE